MTDRTGGLGPVVTRDGIGHGQLEVVWPDEKRLEEEGKGEVPETSWPGAPNFPSLTPLAHLLGFGGYEMRIPRWHALLAFPFPSSVSVSPGVLTFPSSLSLRTPSPQQSPLPVSCPFLLSLPPPSSPVLQSPAMARTIDYLKKFGACSRTAAATP